jgi:hypothetical protein
VHPLARGATTRASHSSILPGWEGQLSSCAGGALTAGEALTASLTLKGQWRTREALGSLAQDPTLANAVACGTGTTSVVVALGIGKSARASPASWPLERMDKSPQALSTGHEGGNASTRPYPKPCFCFQPPAIGVKHVSPCSTKHPRHDTKPPPAAMPQSAAGRKSSESDDNRRAWRRARPREVSPPFQTPSRPSAARG